MTILRPFLFRDNFTYFYGKHLFVATRATIFFFRQMTLAKQITQFCHVSLLIQDTSRSYLKPHYVLISYTLFLGYDTKTLARI